MKILSYSKTARQVLLSNLTDRFDLGRIIVICKDELTETDFKKEIDGNNLKYQDNLICFKEQHKFFDEIGEIVATTIGGKTKDKLREEYGHSKRASALLEEMIADIADDALVVCWIDMAHEIIKIYDTVVLADVEDLDVTILDFVKSIRLAEDDRKLADLNKIEDTGEIEEPLIDDRL